MTEIVRRWTRQLKVRNSIKTHNRERKKEEYMLTYAARCHGDADGKRAGHI